MNPEMIPRIFSIAFITWFLFIDFNLTEKIAKILFQRSDEQVTNNEG